MSRSYQSKIANQKSQIVTTDPTVLICRAKRRYSDEVGARANASIICAEFSLDKVNVYPCPHCRGWHVTTDNKGARGRVTADATYVEKTTADRPTPTEAGARK